jgi:hypothetical protein
MSEEDRKEQLRCWYIVVFSARLAHYENGGVCYIFKNRNDLEDYCKKNNIESNAETLLINEEWRQNLVGRKIRTVNLISSQNADLVRDICKRRIEQGYDVVFNDMLEDK